MNVPCPVHEDRRPIIPAASAGARSAVSARCGCGGTSSARPAAPATPGGTRPGRASAEVALSADPAGAGRVLAARRRGAVLPRLFALKTVSDARSAEPGCARGPSLERLARRSRSSPSVAETPTAPRIEGAGPGGRGRLSLRASGGSSPCRRRCRRAVSVSTASRVKGPLPRSAPMPAVPPAAGRESPWRSPPPRPVLVRRPELLRLPDLTPRPARARSPRSSSPSTPAPRTAGPRDPGRARRAAGSERRSS